LACQTRPVFDFGQKAGKNELAHGFKCQVFIGIYQATAAVCQNVLCEQVGQKR
jgi:hypothetical protein